MPAFSYLGGDHGKGLLESALAAPQQTLGGRFLHRTILDKAAALFRSLVKNHPLKDGNKRLGLTTVTVFLTFNGYLFYPPKDEAVAFALKMAATEGSVELRGISRWLRKHSISVKAYRSKSAAEQKNWLTVVQGATGFTRRLIGRLIKQVDQLTAEIAPQTRRSEPL